MRRGRILGGGEARSKKKQKHFGFFFFPSNFTSFFNKLFWGTCVWIGHGCGSVEELFKDHLNNRRNMMNYISLPHFLHAGDLCWRVLRSGSQKHHQITKKARERRRGDTPLIRSVSASDGITSTWTTSSPLSRCRSEEKGIKTFKEISVRSPRRRRQLHKDGRCVFFPPARAAAPSLEKKNIYIEMLR